MGRAAEFSALVQSDRFVSGIDLVLPDLSARKTPAAGARTNLWCAGGRDAIWDFYVRSLLHADPLPDAQPKDRQLSKSPRVPPPQWKHAERSGDRPAFLHRRIPAGLCQHHGPADQSLWRCQARHVAAFAQPVGDVFALGGPQRLPGFALDVPQPVSRDSGGSPPARGAPPQRAGLLPAVLQVHRRFLWVCGERGRRTQDRSEGSGATKERATGTTTAAATARRKGWPRRQLVITRTVQHCTIVDKNERTNVVQ
mmetsp:Transcript_17859/g.38969  ORF Transcript_17859/g.38969 Transcript_17859/m.38969 type:complete len:254 (-) Transcript_17859:75-836(-)